MLLVSYHPKTIPLQQVISVLRGPGSHLNVNT